MPFLEIKVVFGNRKKYIKKSFGLFVNFDFIYKIQYLKPILCQTRKTFF